MLKLVINSIATSPGGGLTNLLGLLEGWDDAGSELDITIIVSHPEALAALRDAPGSYSVLELPPMSMLRRLRWESFQLPRLLRDLQADALLSNNFASPGAPCPQIVHHQNLFLWSDWLPKRTVRLSIQRWMARKTVDEATSNVFISEFLRSKALERVPFLADSSVVIHYGLSEHFLNQTDGQREGPIPAYRLCAIQSPSIFKDNDSLLQAFSELVSSEPDRPWVLEIAGYGEWDRWKQLASNLGILDRVVWLGHVDSHEIAEMLRRSDCLIYPSVMEAFGIPILEGMAAGCPVIAVASGPADEISQGAFVSVHPRQPEEIVRAVRSIQNDTATREELVRAGRKRAQDFSWRRAAIAFFDVIERTVAAKN